MAYQQVTLPAPAANGSGAAVDMSTFGGTKTITVSSGGAGAASPPSVIIEVSNQASPTKWAPLAFFAPDGSQTVEVACRWMRATVTGYIGGSAPSVEVGGTDEGTDFATLVAPAGDGSGAGVDTSSLGSFKTVHVGGPFQGALNIEISEDGGATYQQKLSFQSGQAGVQSAVFVADFMRVSRNGVPTIDPGTPIINIGGTEVGGGGGGGGSGNAQVFRYTADGTEGGTITVPLPAARATPLYNVQATFGGPRGNALKSINPIASTFTETEFEADLGADAEAGDIYMFTVEDYTGVI
jgi:hypothetical protein